MSDVSITPDKLLQIVELLDRDEDPQLDVNYWENGGGDTDEEAHAIFRELCVLWLEGFGVAAVGEALLLLLRSEERP